MHGGMQMAGMYPVMQGMPGMVPMQSAYGYTMQHMRPGMAENMMAAAAAAAQQQQMAAYQMAYGLYPGAGMASPLTLSPTSGGGGGHPLSPTHSGTMLRQPSLGRRSGGPRYSSGSGGGSHRSSAAQTPRTSDLPSPSQPLTPGGVPPAELPAAAAADAAQVLQKEQQQQHEGVAAPPPAQQEQAAH